MQKIYVDNSSTSYPKAPAVSRVMADYIDTVGCNVNRGGYDASYDPKRLSKKNEDISPRNPSIFIWAFEYKRRGALHHAFNKRNFKHGGDVKWTLSN